MTDLQKFLLFLSQFELSCSKIQQILDNMNGDLSIKRFCKTKFDKNILSQEIFSKMKDRSDEQFALNIYKNLQDRDITILTKYDDNYPSKLKYFHDAPFFLYCKGDLSLLEQNSLAVVGSRKPTNYGRIVTEKLVRDIARSGIVIISGLAYGVDSIAHRACLENGGKTIAVLGSGFNEIYPAANQSLADEIAKNGLLISEYPPERKATKFSFPQRNRIIAGLGDGVLITEASLKSGTIHTKDFALEYGKDIYAVPGNINSELSALTNNLIKSGQAELVENAKDILNHYGAVQVEQKQASYQLSLEEQVIVNLLADGEKDLDYLTKNSNLSIHLFNSCLTTLEIRGIIRRMSGGNIALI